jgi:protoporphyrinogen/coproporphyrinogen III oxidase
VFRWPLGNPQYDVGHLERMQQVEAAVSEVPGLFLAGSGYRGIGLPDCIRSGKTAAGAATA